MSTVHLCVLGNFPSGGYVSSHPTRKPDFFPALPRETPSLFRHGHLVNVPTHATVSALWDMVTLVHRLKDECMWALDSKVCLVATTIEAFHVALVAGRLMKHPGSRVLEMLVGTIKTMLDSRARCSISKPVVLVENQVHLYYAPLPDTLLATPVDRGHLTSLWSRRVSSLVERGFEFLGSPSLFSSNRPAHLLYNDDLHHLASREEAFRVYGSFVPLKMTLLFSEESGNSYLPASPAEYEALSMVPGCTCCLLMTGLYKGKLTSLVFPVAADHLKGYHEEFSPTEDTIAAPMVVACQEGTQAPKHVRPSYKEKPNRRLFNFWLPALWRLQLFYTIRIGVSLDRKRAVTARELLNDLSVAEWPREEGAAFLGGVRAALVVNRGTRERALLHGLENPLCHQIVLGDYSQEGHSVETLLTLALERAMGSLEDTVTESMMALGCYLNTAMTHLDHRELILLPDGVRSFARKKANNKKTTATTTEAPPPKKVKLEDDDDNNNNDEEEEEVDTPLQDPDDPKGDGGYIYRPPSHIGLHTGPIVHMDFASFYPTLVIEHGYSPDRYGLLPLALARLLKLRKKTDNVAFKLLANYCYGWLQAVSPSLRSEVAEKGRDILVSARDYVNNLRDANDQPFAKVLYCVTDSMFVQISSQESPEPMGSSPEQMNSSPPTPTYTEPCEVGTPPPTDLFCTSGRSPKPIGFGDSPSALEIMVQAHVKERHHVEMPISIKETLRFMVLGQRKHAVYGMCESGAVMGRGLLYQGMRVPKIAGVMMDSFLAELIFAITENNLTIEALEAFLAKYVGHIKITLLQLKTQAQAQQSANLAAYTAEQRNTILFQLKQQRQELADLMSYSIKVDPKKLWPPPASVAPSLNNNGSLAARMCVRQLPDSDDDLLSLAIQSEKLVCVMTMHLENVGDFAETTDYFMRSDPARVTCDPMQLLRFLATEVHQLTSPLFRDQDERDQLQVIINRLFNS